jgi:hypothetical protein
MSGQNLEDILAIERAGWQSLVDGTGAGFYRDTAVGDALLVVPGTVMPVSDWIESLAGPQWSSFRISDASLVELGDDAAALVYRADATRVGADPYAALITSTYRREGGRWKLALHQQTPLT